LKPGIHKLPILTRKLYTDNELEVSGHTVLYIWDGFATKIDFTGARHEELATAYYEWLRKKKPIFPKVPLD